MNFTVIELDWLELNNDTCCLITAVFEFLIFDQVCILDSVIFLFIIVKLLWNNLYWKKYKKKLSKNIIYYFIYYIIYILLLFTSKECIVP